MTVDDDRAALERIAATWQAQPVAEQEAMLAQLGRMLGYLDPTDDAEYELVVNARRLMATIKAGFGRNMGLTPV